MDNSQVFEDLDSFELTEDNINKGLMEMKPYENLSHLQDPNKDHLIKLGKTTPPALSHADNEEAVSVGDKQTVHKKEEEMSPQQLPMNSPGFQIRENSNPLNLGKLHEDKSNGHNLTGFKGIISPMVKQETPVQNQQLPSLSKRNISNVTLANLNQSKQSKDADNQSFTFDHGNNTGSMKSPNSFVQYSGQTSGHPHASPSAFKVNSKSPFPLQSPNMLFGQMSGPAKNGNTTSDKNSAQFAGTEQGSQKPKADTKLMRMLDEIGDIEESFAATRAALKDKKAYQLEHGDTEKKKKRKAKLKMKSKGLKLAIPTKNKFLPPSQDAPKPEASKTSPVPFFNPTPTKRLINFNASDNKEENSLF
jgi:hypothetical protein